LGVLDAEMWLGDGQRGARCTRRARGSIILGCAWF